MEPLNEENTSIIEELQQTIQQLRANLEQSAHENKKANDQLNQEFLQTELTLKNTVIKLREEVANLQQRYKEQSDQFNHAKILFQNEKINQDKHFQAHLHQVRSEFEQQLQKQGLAYQQQNRLHQIEIDELHAQLIHLRKQFDLSPLEPH